MEGFNLQICTFNCCSRTKNIDLIRELTASHYDAILLQETFVTEDKSGILDYIHENYESIGVISMRRKPWLLLPDARRAEWPFYGEKKYEASS